MGAQSARIYTNDHCTGCNQCISVCTVPEANYAVLKQGKNKIHIDGEKCINCGKCLEVCPHDARDYLDDTDRFLDRLGSGKLSVVAAPAIRTNFPDYEKLLGTLRGLGAKQMYDTSFGADITTWAYLRYIQKNNATGMISQPCPAVVNYIEKHRPELISTLVPVHSPAMCTAIFMKKYRGIQDEIAFLSPCIAKKDEFDDPNTYGLFQYNVTYRKLAAALKARGIDYRKSPEDHFDNDRHGMGSIYPMPGGLKVNVNKVLPDAWIYQVEGQPEVKHFLDGYGSVGSASRPFMVDILNCVKGCNIGTGANNCAHDDMRVSKVMHEHLHKDAPVAKAPLGKRVETAKTLKELDAALKLEDFIRRYSKKPVHYTRISDAQREKAYADLQKTSAREREVNCGCCGYSTCREMAECVAKGLNHVGNCVEYHKSVLRHQQDEIQQMLAQQKENSHEVQENVQRIFDSLSVNARKTEEAVQQVSQINGELGVLQDVADKMNELVDVLRNQVGQYVNLSSDIITISTQTKLLSMNASVEAAHAKEYGKGFAVVAEEMKNLSDQSSHSAKEIIASNEKVFPMLEEVREFSDTLNNRTKAISGSTVQILDSMRLIEEIEQQVTSAASNIVNHE